MMFVLVDLGHPERAWHFIPIIGKFNFPASILAWDVLVLNGYLALNIAIPFYVLFKHYQDKEPQSAVYFGFVVLAMFWAISIHTVTAFMFSSNPSRPMWHTALLGPRFIASAFASGPALIILSLGAVRKFTNYEISRSVIDTLALIMTVALQISMFFVGVELFTDFYNETSHGASVRYLFLGLDGAGSLQTWIWAALAMNLVALFILMVHPLRRNMKYLNVACVLGFIGIWIEKGMGLVVPGFIPTTLGEVFEYAPTGTEISIAVGIWSFGILVFSMLVKLVVSIETGKVRQHQPVQPILDDRGQAVT
jgi:molybdopterin-containing oxidoreductase family membrane subunit